MVVTDLTMSLEEVEGFWNFGLCSVGTWKKSNSEDRGLESEILEGCVKTLSRPFIILNYYPEILIIWYSEAVINKYQNY